MFDMRWPWGPCGVEHSGSTLLEGVHDFIDEEQSPTNDGRQPHDQLRASVILPGPDEGPSQGDVV